MVKDSLVAIEVDRMYLFIVLLAILFMIFVFCFLLYLMYDIIRKPKKRYSWFLLTSALSVFIFLLWVSLDYFNLV